MSRSASKVLREARSSHAPNSQKAPEAEDLWDDWDCQETCLQETFQRVFLHHCCVKTFPFPAGASDSPEEVS